MKINLKRRDYHKYQWEKGEWALAAGQAVFVTGFLSWFFYRSVWAMLPLATVGILFFRRCKEQKRQACQNELTWQFKECILSVASSLQAGYAVENAFLESREDMRMLYGEQCLMYQELELIRRGMIINITLEELLRDLAERSDCEEIQQFSCIFSIAKRSGGNLSEIIHSSAELIGQRIDASQEIKTLLSGRRLEQKIMECMPFGIVTYISLTYPGYFDCLYHNVQGIAIMSACLVVYLAAYFLGERMLEHISENLI